MDRAAIAHRRVYQLGLTAPPLESAAAVLRWLGAVQAQDYSSGKWSIAQRLRGVTDAELERAFDAGAILRVHALRPTWHFLLPEDLVWVQALTGPRVQARNQLYYRRGGLDEDALALSEGVLSKAMANGRHLTRVEVQAELAGAGIHVQREALAYVLMSAELNARICSGALKGRQHTYALVEERAPRGRDLRGDEALAELTRRYFTSHGPSTTRDFGWWSSLSAAEIRRGLALLPELHHEVVDGTTFWFADNAYERAPAPCVRLLQAYDEYFVGYGATKWLLDQSGAARAWLTEPRMVHGLVLDTQVVGSWRRVLGRDAVTVEIDLVRPPSEVERGALEAAVEGYGRFMGSAARAAIGCRDG